MNNVCIVYFSSLNPHYTVILFYYIMVVTEVLFPEQKKR
uniref:Uncharacterized protein n=1 Tax=Anguilla anguilla TaxID=7936 RepID=A0A0E9UCE1_ANGAN